MKKSRPTERKSSPLSRLKKSLAKQKNQTKAITEHSVSGEASLAPAKNQQRAKKPLTKLAKILIGGGAVLGVFAIAAIIMLIISSGGGKVKVFSVSDVSMMEGMIGMGGEMQGEVTAENMQTVYVSESQQVKEIYVKEGDTVKKGDRLMSFDTTLDVLEVDKKALEVTQKELQLANLKRQLSEVNTYRPSVPTTPPAAPTQPADIVGGDTVTDHKLIAGDGTQEHPFIYVIATDSIPCDSEFINTLFFNAGGASEVWAVYQRRASNTTNGTVKDAWGVKYINVSGSPSFAFFDASSYIYTIPEPEFPEDTGSGFTAAEIATMKADLIKQINELDLEIRIANVEVKQMRLELASGDVLAEVDGTVVSVNRPTAVVSSTDSFYGDKPLIKVSGGGGYYVNGTISELQLDDISIGDPVTVMSWENGSTYEGSITEIINLPTDNMWYSGAVASYYPFTVFIDGSANLQQFEYVSITLGGVDGGTGFYVESPFLLEENGKYYAYAESSEGRLEKRQLVTGGTLWGSYIQVFSGLTPEDYVAFPYGRKVREGAKVTERPINELWEDAY